MLAVLLALTLAAPSPTPAPAIDPKLLQGLEWRSLGPYRGGRVTAVVGVPGQPRVYYFGGTGGGVFKTTDGGTTWEPTTDGTLTTGSVGAIAVADSDPNVLYAGMGESPIRGNVSHGDGVYKSTDAGKTWKHVGLRDSRQIARIRIHPQDPDLVYVAAQGHAFGPNAERGIFRSKDGGKSWQKVAFVDDKTGASDLAMDPSNPRVLYAGFWQVVRRPWSFESGGPGSQLRRSTDGGDSWERVEGDGLPKGTWGIVGVAVSAANPSRVYAIIEAEKGGVFRSDDGGKKWQRTNDDNELRQRAWYYSRIYADPKDADSVYVLNVQFFRSKDGGRGFKPVRTPHGDNHDLWIAPDDPQRMIESNDGGAQVSLDGGATWTRQDNQPTGQFYHVITDDRFPYRVYGAQQDNSTVAIASRTDHGGIGPSDWHAVGGCESGYIAPRPGDAEVVYAGCYGGLVTRYDHRTGQERDISVYPENPMGWGAEGMKYRFQWTFPIVASPHDPGTLYAAGNRLFKSTNEGQSWEALSGDLTRNDPGKLGPSGGPITKDNTSVEYYCTIFAMAESKRERGLLWTGSDDGLIHVSRDGGKSWANVTPKDLPEWSMVSQIDPSPHDAATAFVAVNRYKLDDLRPFVYVTRDYGRTWTQRSSGIPEDAFVRVVREDPARRGLLYAGTETGIYVSWDEGAHWQSLQLKLPVVPITDLQVKDDDLVISTQGRGFWILDAISPLRQASPAFAEEDARLFKPGAVHRFFGGGGRRPRPGVGHNPPDGAIVYYFLRNAPKEKEEVSLEFLDASGRSLRAFANVSKDKETGDGGEKAESASSGGEEDAGRTIPAKAGLNRFAWNLRLEEATKVKGMILWGGGTDGPVVVPGTYQVKLTVGGRSWTESFEVRKDPRLAATAADFQKQFDLLLKIRDSLGEAHDAILRIRAVRDQATAAAERAKGTPDEKTIAEAAEAFKRKLTAVEEALYQTKNKAPQDPLNYPIRLNNKLSWLANVVGSADAAPTDASYAVYDDVASRIAAELATLKQVLDTELPGFNQLVREKQVPAVVLKPEKR